MKLPLESITVGKRLREDYGDIRGLAASIEKYGLFAPLVVDDEGTLVAGGRRLRAVQMLGWQSVDVRDIGELTDAERAEIEVEENEQRKSLSPFERSKATLTDAKKVAPIIAGKRAEQAAHSPTSLSEVGEDRPWRRTYDAPKSDVAQALGVSVGKLVKDEQHVAAAEKYPELQAPEITQRAAIEIAKSLDVLPEPEREERREVFRTVGPAALTLAEGETFPTGKLSAEQKAFYESFKDLMKLSKWKSLDPTVVADTPPVEAVHPAVVELGKVVEWVTRLHNALRAREERPTLRAVTN
jgi:hypothetical protein